MKHEIINQGKYLLIVTERGVYEGWAYHPTSNNVYRFGDLITSFERKVIAHLPLNGSPIIQGVDLLPPLVDDDAVKWARSQYSSEEGDYEEIYYLGLIKGYNKAKEKYKYTEEDLRKAFLKGVSVTAQGYNAEYANDYDPNIECEFGQEADKFIQSLSQPKMPIGFDCVTIDKIALDGHTIIGTEPTTTTTPEGHTEWIGTYLYAENI